jgi:membrane protease YdiL (CAAX protease family)
VVFFVVMEGAFRLLRAIGVPFVSMSDGFLEHGWSRAAVYGFIAVAPPVYEEIAFRGIIQGKLQALTGETEAWLIQAALFSVLHLSPVIFITHFGMGIALGWIRRRTQSLYPGMLIHGLWNAWVVWQELSG